MTAPAARAQRRPAQGRTRMSDTATPTGRHPVREQLDHPVIDADGHFVA